MKRMKRRLVSLCFTILMLGCSISANAVEIDLTSLANGDSQSHSHILVNAQDSEYHWKYCSMCNTIFDKAEHSLSVKYTYPDKMCYPNNRKISSCSGCSYLKQSTVSAEHTLNPSVSVLIGNDGEYVFTYRCSVCGTYDNDNTTPHYTTDGRQVIFGQVNPPFTMYTKLGGQITVPAITQWYHWHNKDNAKTTGTCVLSPDKTKITLTLRTEVDAATWALRNNAKSQGKLTMDFAYSMAFYYGSASSPAGYSGFFIEKSNITINESTRTITTTYDVPVCDMTRNCNSVPLLSGCLSFSVKDGSIIYNYEVGGIDWDVYDLLYRTPSISSVTTRN